MSGGTTKKPEPPAEPVVQPLMQTSPKDVCGCDEAQALRAELAVVTAEHDYMLTGLSPTEIRVMRQELAKEREHAFDGQEEH